MDGSKKIRQGYPTYTEPDPNKSGQNGAHRRMTDRQRVLTASRVRGVPGSDDMRVMLEMLAVAAVVIGNNTRKCSQPDRTQRPGLFACTRRLTRPPLGLSS
jgi:hypothetical protein